MGPVQTVKFKLREMNLLLPNPPFLTPCATTAMTMGSWAMVTVAWMVATAMAVVMVATLATAHAAWEDSGVLASIEIFQNADSLDIFLSLYNDSLLY